MSYYRPASGKIAMVISFSLALAGVLALSVSTIVWAAGANGGLAALVTGGIVSLILGFFAALIGWGSV